MSLRRILKEFDHFTNNHQDYIESVEKVSDNAFEWLVLLKGPEESPYRGGKYKIKIEFPRDYPFKAPKIQILTKILHPNILPNGMFCSCCWLFTERNWSPSSTVQRCMESIYEIFREYDDQCDVSFDSFNLHKIDQFEFYLIARDYTLKYASN